MKLSEAIRLGAMMGKQLFGRFRSFEDGDDSSCALGSALKAIGSADCSVTEITDRFSWITVVNVACPACPAKDTCASVTVHLNDDHRWTRDAIADWVATIEPAEVHASETNGQCSLGTGPIGPSPEEETAVMKIG